MIERLGYGPSSCNIINKINELIDVINTSTKNPDEVARMCPRCKQFTLNEMDNACVFLCSTCNFRIEAKSKSQLKRIHTQIKGEWRGFI